MIFTFSITLLLLYIITFIAYLFDVKKENSPLSKIKRVILFVTLFFHLITLFYLFETYEHFPITNKFELFTIVAFSVAFVYFLLELLTEIHGTGFLIIFFAMLFQFLALALFSASRPTAQTAINSYIGFHVFAAILGYVALTISIAYGAMYVILASKLKKNKFDKFFNQLPNLEILLKLSTVSFYSGFIILSVTICLGFFWLPKIFPDYNLYDPKVILTLFVWFVYAICAFLNIFKIIHGKKFVYGALAVYGVLLFASIVTTLLTNTFHTF